MKRLFHLSTTDRQLCWFDQDWKQIKAFVEKNNIEGIELGLTIDYPIEKIPKELITGVHLTFYPMWLDFWRQDQEKLNKLFVSEEACKAYYGGSTPRCLVESYHKQYERAKLLGAKYMVFHVSHVLPEDSFTYEYTYTDKEIMEAALELIHAAFPQEEDGPMLLFENLWWPGLNYMDAELTKWFIESVKYPNKGLVVDISHLILTNPQIGSEKQACAYIKQKVDALGEVRKWIKTIHLNKALPRNYMKRDFTYLLENYKSSKDKKQQVAILKKHIKALDGHMPFDHPIAKDIVTYIDPEYCVFETAPGSRYELAYFIKKQNEALGICPIKKL